MDRSFEEPTWGNFDNNDEADSVWGFNKVSMVLLDAYLCA